MIRIFGPGHFSRSRPGPAGKAQVPSLRPKKWISAPTSIGSRPVSDCYHVDDLSIHFSHEVGQETYLRLGREEFMRRPALTMLWIPREYSRIRFWSSLKLIAALLGHRQDTHARSDVFEWLFLKPVAWPKVYLARALRLILHHFTSLYYHLHQVQLQG